MEKQEVKFSTAQQLLLKWFQIILIGVCGVVFIFILFTNSSSLQKLDSYILLILIIFFLLGISHYLFRKKNFTISSGLLVLTGVIGPWGSVIIDYSISQGNLFPLVYLTLPIIFSGFFTSLSVNIIVGLIQVVGLLIFIFSNQIGFSGGVSSLFFYVVFIFAISLIINLLNRSNKRIIDQQVERMRAEIEESKKRFELAMAATKDGLFDWNLLNNEIYYSPGWKSMLGYKDDELPNDFSIWEDLTQPEDAKKSWEMQQELINKERDRFELEYKMKHKDGHWVDILSRATAIFDESGKAIRIVGTHIDISERKQAEEEKLKFEISLRQSQKLEEIGTLASGVAHEINNPITGIMNYAQLINERLEPSQVQLHEFAIGIKDETERVAEIVSNLLDFSRHEKQSHSPARLKDIVDSTLSLIRTVVHKDQIELKVEIPDNLPEIKCRSQQIQQVLMNLLTNARYAVNDRYPEYDPDKIINITVHQFNKDGRSWLRTTVEDHGSGIPAEVSEKIFNPFFTTKDRTKGTGLGLSISQGIARDHHGALTFESEENKRTRFYLDLPVDNGWENS